MKKNIVIKIWLLVLTIILCNMPLIAVAQKLPKIQQTGKRAPTGIKIDGRTNEWNDEFQAYNISNRIYYTLSNDDDNLYLTVRASDGYGNEKSIFGISFMVKLPVENGNKSKENASVTFPVVMKTQQTSPIRLTVETVRKLQHDTTNRVKKKIDSLKSFANKCIDESFKEIKVTGIKEIQEPTISIYNTEGIKAAAQFNEHMQYTYELAIPLKYLGTAINSGQKFNYNIKMNGLPEKAPGSPYPLPTISGNIMQFLGPDNAYVTYPTDFSGVYTLAMK